MFKGLFNHSAPMVATTRRQVFVGCRLESCLKSPGRPQTLRGCCLKRPQALGGCCSEKPAVCFGTISGPRPLAARMLQRISFKIISKPFLPKATQMLQMISLGLIYCLIFINFGHGFEPKAAHDLDFERTLHSKWLSTRNGFGITPKGPIGPSPKGRRRRP